MRHPDHPIGVERVFARVEYDVDKPDSDVTIHIHTHEGCDEEEREELRKSVINVLAKTMKDFGVPVEAIKEVGGHLEVRFLPQGYDSFDGVPFGESPLIRVAHQNYRRYVKFREPWIDYIEKKKKEKAKETETKTETRDS